MIKILLSLLIIKEIKSLNVKLFTSRHCRQCSKFKDKYTKLQNHYPNVKFETLDLRENIDVAKKAKIYSIPFILFDEGINDIDRVLCVPRNYDTIEDRCRESNTNSDDQSGDYISPCSNNN